MLTENRSVGVMKGVRVKLVRKESAMAKTDPKDSKGQAKVHTATRINPETGLSETKDFTQAEWRARDKKAGWERPDEVEDDGAEDVPPAEGGETGGGTSQG